MELNELLQHMSEQGSVILLKLDSGWFCSIILSGERGYTSVSDALTPEDAVRGVYSQLGPLLLAAADNDSEGLAK